MWIRSAPICALSAGFTFSLAIVVRDDRTRHPVESDATAVGHDQLWACERERLDRGYVPTAAPVLGRQARRYADIRSTSGQSSGVNIASSACGTPFSAWRTNSLNPTLVTS